MSEGSDKRITFGEFELNPGRRRLLKRGEAIRLSSRAFDLLLTLVTNRGKVLTRTELMDEVWKDQFVEENNVSVQISALRKALDDRKSTPRFLVTIPGQGYKFIADVQEGGRNGEVVIEKHETVRIVVEEEDSEHSISPVTDTEVRIVPPLLPAATSRAGTTIEPRGRIRYLIASALIVGAVLVGAFGYTRYNAKTLVPFFGANIKQLTTKGAIGWAAVSPDGKFYAYAVNERGEYKQSLWLGQTDGTTDIQLRPAVGNYQGMAFSKDGQTLYFTVSHGEPADTGLFRMSLFGGVAEKLFDGIRTSFAISPDGTRLAYARSSTQAGLSAVVIVNIDGSDEREITTRPDDLGFGYRLAWSHDGSKLAITASSDPAKDNPQVFIVSVADGTIEQLTSLDWLQVHNLAWQKDDRGLIAVAINKGEARRHLWHLPYPGGQPSRISNDTDTYGSALNISADGESLMAVQLRNEGNLWIAPADDLAAARQVTFSSINGMYGWYGFDWLDDRRIVFSGGIDRSSVLFTIDADGTNIRQITSTGYYDHQPSVTSDGRLILFQSNRSGNMEVWSINTDGGDPRQLTRSGGNAGPHPTPDGQWVYYLSSQKGGKHSIRKVPIEGGEEVIVTERTFASEPRVSPDGKLVACSFRPEGKAPMEIAALSVEDGTPVHRFKVPKTINLNQSMIWAPDGKAICYRDWANGVWCQSLEGGEPNKIEGLPYEKIYKFGWSDDGKQFAFARGREISDAVVFRPSQ